MYLDDVVRGKRVTLLGSAPNACLSGHDGDLLICVNAAALGISEKCIPDVTIMNTSVAGSTEAGVPTRERLHELVTKLLVVVESGTPLQESWPVFKAIKRESERYITLAQRTQFLEDFLGKPLVAQTGGNNVPSTGFFACLLLLASGASYVEMKGFSFGGGHSYLNTFFQRGHIERDHEVMSFILNEALPVGFPEGLV